MVQSVQLFELAAQQARWLAARQSAIAGNIANVNTPGYGTVEIEPFERVLNSHRVSMVNTAPGHIPIGGAGSSYGMRAADEPSMLPSENSVVLENELIKSSEVRRAFDLNTAIVKSFHRMMMMNTKV